MNALLSPSTFCLGDRCASDGLDGLTAARTELINYVARHRSAVRDGEAGYRFKFETTAVDFRAFFRDGTGAPACIVPPPLPGDNPAKKPPKQDESRIPTRFIVRSNVADLGVGRDDDAFKKVDRASLSIINNRVQENTAYNIQGVFGVGFGQFPITEVPGTYLEFIPYFSFKRQQTTGNSPADAPDVYNLGGGLIADLQFGAGPLGNDLQFSTNYTSSQRSGARIANGSLIYTPYPDPTIIPGISRFRRFGSVLITLTPQLKYIFGSVMADGGDPDLAGTSDFHRFGARVELATLIDSGTFEGTGFNVAYEYLNNASGGPVKNIERFEASTSYTFPKQKLWSVILKYVDGRDLDTLEVERKWTFGLGLKY